jgi:hypothetical protein
LAIFQILRVRFRGQSLYPRKPFQRRDCLAPPGHELNHLNLTLARRILAPRNNYRPFHAEISAHGKYTATPHLAWQARRRYNAGRHYPIYLVCGIAPIDE